MTKLVNILKKPVAAASILGIALASGVASADFNPKFYVGAGVDYNFYSKNKDVWNTVFNNSTFSQKVNGMNLVVPVLGVKFNENIGIEVGYSFNKKYKVTADNLYKNIFGGQGINASYNGKLRNMYLDLVGFMPIADQIELIGGIGIGKLNLKGDSNVTFSNVPAGQTANATIKIKNKLSLRAKIGAIYNITNSIGLRLLASYQTINSKINSDYNYNNNAGNSFKGTLEQKGLKGMSSIGLAATYTF